MKTLTKLKTFADEFQKENELIFLLKANGYSIEIYDEEGILICLAYGSGKNGKKVGFTCGTDEAFGYSSFSKNILWIWKDRFDKWSYCNKIPKKMKNDEIIKLLKRDEDWFDANPDWIGK